MKRLSSFNLKACTALCAIMLGFSGCALQGGTSGIKKQSAAATAVGEQKKRSVLKDTERFLPKPILSATDKPYTPQKNPYTATTRKIKRESVMLFIMAKNAQTAGDVTSAQKHYSKIVETDDTLSGPWVKLGDIERKQGDPKLAIEHYKKALSINPKNVNAYQKLASTYRDRGLYTLAQNTYYDALKVWPDFPEAHLNVGILYDLYFNKTESAIRHMQAYQMLTKGKNSQVAGWLKEMQQRLKGVSSNPATGEKVGMVTGSGDKN